jgi:hypothetical protein
VGGRRAAVAPHRPAALRPREDVAFIVGICEGEDDPEDGPAIGEQADRHRASPPPGQVVARAVVGIDEPDRPARLTRRAARLLSDVAPPGERLGKARADEALGLDVRLGLVDRAPRASRVVEVAPQDLAGRDRRVESRLERPSPVRQ